MVLHTFDDICIFCMSKESTQHCGCRVPVLGIATIVFGRYLLFEYLDL